MRAACIPDWYVIGYGKLINPNDIDPEGPPDKKTGAPHVTNSKENFGDNNGVIGQKKDGTKFIMTYDQFLHKSFDNSEIAWAFQNGPILLQNGKNPHSPGTAKFDYAKETQRTAMGFNAQGDLIIITAKNPNQFV